MKEGLKMGTFDHNLILKNQKILKQFHFCILQILFNKFKFCVINIGNTK